MNYRLTDAHIRLTCRELQGQGGAVSGRRLRAELRRRYGAVGKTERIFQIWREETGFQSDNTGLPQRSENRHLLAVADPAVAGRFGSGQDTQPGWLPHKAAPPLETIDPDSELTAEPDARLIEMIYRGIAEDPPWAELSAHIRKKTQSQTARVFFYWFARAEYAALSFADRVSTIGRLRVRYLEQFADEDPMPYGKLAPGKVHPLENFVPRAQLERSRYFKEFLHPSGIDHLATAHADEPSGFKVWINIGRSDRLGPFKAQEIAFVEGILPHLSDALAIFAKMKRVELERDVLRELVENLTIGAIAVDRDGIIVSCNKGAERLLAASKGLTIVNRRLWFSAARQRQEYSQRLSKVIAGKLSAGVVAVGDGVSSTGGLGVLIRPLGPFLDFGGGSLPSAIIYLSDSASQHVGSADLVAELFDLTLTEASLANLLAQGLSLCAAAREMDINENSARTYLKRIFAKTGLHRQSELVSLILHSVSIMTSQKS